MEKVMLNETSSLFITTHWDRKEESLPLLIGELVNDGFEKVVILTDGLMVTAGRGYFPIISALTEANIKVTCWLYDWSFVEEGKPLTLLNSIEGLEVVACPSDPELWEKEFLFSQFGEYADEKIAFISERWVLKMLPMVLWSIGLGDESTSRKEDIFAARVLTDKGIAHKGTEFSVSDKGSPSALLKLVARCIRKLKFECCVLSSYRVEFNQQEQYIAKLGELIKDYTHAIKGDPGIINYLSGEAALYMAFYNNSASLIKDRSLVPHTKAPQMVTVSTQTNAWYEHAVATMLRNTPYSVIIVKEEINDTSRFCIIADTSRNKKCNNKYRISLDELFGSEISEGVVKSESRDYFWCSEATYREIVEPKLVQLFTSFDQTYLDFSITVKGKKLNIQRWINKPKDVELSPKEIREFQEECISNWEKKLKALTT